MQGAFEQKQATMFLASDKLFVLHNALLLESKLPLCTLYKYLYSTCSPVEVTICVRMSGLCRQLMSIRLYELTLTQHVY